MIVRGMNHRELLQLRQSMKWTQAEFAVRLGITSNTYSRLERGERAISLPVARLARITVAFAKEGIDVRRFE